MNDLVRQRLLSLTVKVAIFKRMVIVKMEQKNIVWGVNFF